MHSNNSLFDGLNESQRQAVAHSEGPMLILAGAGSGKTKTLTHRIAYILSSGLANQYQILAVTFTNKAAKEMRSRVAGLMLGGLDDRSFMPYMGTFHGICVKLLRRDGQAIGVPSNFVIYDESDRLSIIKGICKSKNIDDKQNPPKLVASVISNAKNEMKSPSDMLGEARYPSQKIAAEVYSEYQQALRQAGGLDFDDLLIMAVEMMMVEEIRQKWSTQFKYIMIDEYQDTNTAQYKLVKLLVNKNAPNIAVVGDDWQCLPAGSQVSTNTGLKAIEDITTDDSVVAAAGYGKTHTFTVTSVKSFEYSGDLLVVKTASGRCIKVTPNHLLFGRWKEGNMSHFVYLMYAQKYGYRIGVAKGSRNSGKKSTVGLRVRANQERAEKMWVLKVCSTREEAHYYESLIAYKYGIPELVFHAYTNRNMKFSQEYIDMIFKEIDTTGNAKKLMKDLKIDDKYPHFIPSGTTRGGTSRVCLNVVLFGDKRTSVSSPWSASRLSINTTDSSVLDSLRSLGLSVRTGKAGTYRVEAHNLDFGKVEKLKESIDSEMNGKFELQKYAYITNMKFDFVPASHVRVSMCLPILVDGKIIDDEVIAIETTNYKGKVYDLDVDKVHNYVVDDFVVHNSIYSWRGADFRNILKFEKDYPKSLIIKLEQNYRSTKPILDAAHKVITKNQERSDKKLWTAKEFGTAVAIEQAANERAEAELIVRRIKYSVESGNRSYKDYAVLYRTNAQSRSLEESFVRWGLPYTVVGGIRFYDRAEIKDLLSYIRLAYQPNDEASFTRVINTPSRGIGPKSLAGFNDWRDQNNYSLIEALNNVDSALLPPKAMAGFKDFTTTINVLTELATEISVSTLVDTIIKRLGYIKYLDDGTLQGNSKQENVEEFKSVAKEYDNVDLETFLSEVGLISDLDRPGGSDPLNGINIMTVHSAKGLEFPCVYIVGMEEGVFPHSRSLLEPNEMEEERRLCYVAMTRAKEELTLIYTTGRMLYGGLQHNPPSRFLKDIDAELITKHADSGIFSEQASLYSSQNNLGWAAAATATATPAGYNPNVIIDKFDVGEVVSHAVFGIGTITEVNGDNVAVHFSDKGTKSFNLGFAKLTKVEVDQTL